MRRGGKAEVEPKASNDARARARTDIEPEKAGEKSARRTPMERKKRTIIERMQKLGTYKPQYMEAINRTAKLYVQMDEIETAFEKSGGNVVVTHTNKAGAKNFVKNPFLQARDEVYTQLLAHERELGLTPAALKRINEAAMAKEKKSTLGEALKALSG